MRGALEKARETNVGTILVDSHVEQVPKWCIIN